MTDNEILNKIANIVDFDVRVIEPTRDVDVEQDETTNETVFNVECLDKAVTLAIAGTDKNALNAAKLLKEVVKGFGFRKNTDKVKAFLLGDALPPATIEKASYYVYAIQSKNGDAVRDYLWAMVGNNVIVDMGGGITAFCSPKSRDYNSAGEFGMFLRQNLAEEVDHNVKVGVGGLASSISDIPDFYAFAKAALSFGAEFDPTTDFYTYKDYALITMLGALPRRVMLDYVKTVMGKNYKVVLEDPELTSTVDTMICHSLNLSEAARSIYTHRNTLIYRMDKILNLTGLDIHNFNDAMTFRIAYMVYKQLSSEGIA